MATDNSVKRGTFGLLPEPKSHIGSFGISMVINVTIAASLLCDGRAVHQVQEHRYEKTKLKLPVEQP